MAVPDTLIVRDALAVIVLLDVPDELHVAPELNVDVAEALDVDVAVADALEVAEGDPDTVIPLVFVDVLVPRGLLVKLGVLEFVAELLGGL